MSTADDTTPDNAADTSDTQADPQSHLDHDPANKPDIEDDPAHDTGEDEGWTSEGGSTPDGPATV